MTFSAGKSICVAIPTYRRERVLLDTINQLLLLDTPADEILIIDQTEKHEPDTEKWLSEFSQSGKIDWVRCTEPSITQAMNHALMISMSDVVLFLDDDVELTTEIVEQHSLAYENEAVNIVAGQVIQSWQSVLSEEDESYANGKSDDPDAFLFNSARQCWIKRFMGGNFSIRKDVALKLGGFDENFIKVAYRFEAEFADRLQSFGYNILFFPDASIKHLRVASGGTRSYGEHLNTIKPAHSVGRYYYLFVARNVHGRLSKIIGGPFRAVMTKYHLTHLWWIPVTFVAECWGMVWAFLLYVKGPKLINDASK